MGRGYRAFGEEDLRRTLRDAGARKNDEDSGDGGRSRFTRRGEPMGRPRGMAGNVKNAIRPLLVSGDWDRQDDGNRLQALQRPHRRRSWHGEDARIDRVLPDAPVFSSILFGPWRLSGDLE